MMWFDGVLMLTCAMMLKAVNGDMADRKYTSNKRYEIKATSRDTRSRPECAYLFRGEVGGGGGLCLWILSTT